MSGSMRCCTVIVTDTDVKRTDTALKIWAYRCTQNTELISFCRFYSDHRCRSKHIWSDVKRSSASVRRYPGCICLYHLIQGIQETFFWKWGHFHALGRIHHSLCILIRSESNDASILCLIYFQSFKNLLAVLKDTCALIDHHIGICSQSSFIPGAIFVICHIAHIRLMICKTDIFPVQIFLFHNLYSFADVTVIMIF